jgi:hypothetical protein
LYSRFNFSTLYSLDGYLEELVTLIHVHTSLTPGPPIDFMGPQTFSAHKTFSIIRNIDSIIPHLSVNVTCEQKINAALAKNEWIECI